MKKYINYPGHSPVVRPDARATSKEETIAKEWASQFKAKQKFKLAYGDLSEKTLKHLCQSSLSKRTKASVFTLIESRLDVYLYKSGHATSIKHARQLVKQGSVTLNSLPVTHFQIFLNFGDRLSILSSPHKSPLTFYYTKSSIEDWNKKQVLYGGKKAAPLTIRSDKLHLYCDHKYR